MDLGSNSDGDLLQRALDGETVSEPGILELIAVLHAVQAVDQAGLTPRAEFVSELRARLLADDAGSAAPVVPLLPGGPGGGSIRSVEAPGDGDDSAPASSPAAGGDATPGAPASPGEGGTVSVLRFAARPLKLVAAAAASILVTGGALGFASRTAVPGDALYGVKQLLDRAAVQLAGSRYDEGLTYLAQAQEHITEARDLLDGGAPSAHDLDTAYDSATDAASRAQTILMEVYRTEQRADALTELSDFYTRAIPQVDAMRPRVPAASLPAWQRLRDLLGAGEVATLRGLAGCTSCGERATAARQLLAGLPGSSTSSPGSGTSAPGTLPSTRGGATASSPAPSVPRPSGATSAGGVPLPGVKVTGGVTLPGGTIHLPGVGITSTGAGVGGGGVTLPGATVSLPGAGITSSTIGIGGGGITLPGATLPLPSTTLGLPKLPTALDPTKILPTKLLP
ncbi:hypothetical protein GCM10009868_10150 [Terrabacter aerolatus]|uniref:DUF5667 domain-containing protein n=1 Tax=Terrabacter aerolatus TaxID=422442 RepID=A0A512D6N1_9MICO|nr:DUF5667 domain-containing protein [Terrabacter aerolatus]GEO32138.1 hypothetical protein TAE01_39480 [Terrabacter aerolatus]